MEWRGEEKLELERQNLKISGYYFSLMNWKQLGKPSMKIMCFFRTGLKLGSGVSSLGLGPKKGFN